MSDELNVRVERGEDRYEVFLDDVPAGFTAFYTDEEGSTVFPHTQVDPAFKGHGVASILVERALEDEAKRGETIVPLCPFVAKYLREHEVPGLKVAWP